MAFCEGLTRQAISTAQPRTKASSRVTCANKLMLRGILTEFSRSSSFAAEGTRQEQTKAQAWLTERYATLLFRMLMAEAGFL